MEKGVEGTERGRAMGGGEKLGQPQQHELCLDDQRSAVPMPTFWMKRNLLEELGAVGQ